MEGLERRYYSQSEDAALKSERGQNGVFYKGEWKVIVMEILWEQIFLMQK